MQYCNAMQNAKYQNKNKIKNYIYKFNESFKIKKTIWC